MTQRPKLTLERTFDATPDEVWEVWTTKDGIEGYLGPDGFKVEVRELDLRPGGALVYVMRAVGAEQIEYMKQAGLQMANTQRVTFVEIDPPRRLVTRELANFIPGVAPYEVETMLELEPTARGTRLVLTFDAMHDPQWTEMARLGRESELRKIAELLSARK